MNKKLIKMEVSEEEADFLNSLRNYLKSYPNGYPELLWDLQKMFDDMVEPFKD